jgi:glutaredoxin-like protein NrdH
MTKKQLTALGIPHIVIDLDKTPEARAEIDPLGYTSAPVVVVGDESWFGFRLERIKNLSARMLAEKKEQLLAVS